MFLVRFAAALLLFTLTCCAGLAQQSQPAVTHGGTASTEQPLPESAKTPEPALEAKVQVPASGADVVPSAGKAAGKETEGKKRKEKKEKKPKTKKLLVDSGTLTVDGWTGKAQLNYEVTDLKYLYFYAPGVGTVVVSPDKFAGAVEQKNAFDKETLSVTVEGHSIQLTSSKFLVGKKPENAWVKLDTGFQADGKYPVMGYGSIASAPYVWPGAKPQQVKAKMAVAGAPPLPQGLRPKMAVAACLTVEGKVCPTVTAPIASAASSKAVVESSVQGGTTPAAGSAVPASVAASGSVAPAVRH